MTLLALYILKKGTPGTFSVLLRPKAAYKYKKVITRGPAHEKGIKGTVYTMEIKEPGSDKNLRLSVILGKAWNGSYSCISS